ncbi:3-hydroxyisobutyrate dehydrogenase-like beta-hydroxyacid dehydrogenase [Actinomadura pelletieri DSM 43383]|uniref:3-hydroxyisobutyrate dehydrogenase-like beta-hydroxyacid dehydrogenase n=1 Tax=Actinomadura pelletieri DSM 43383 TaxID=1120940 RepID=A0A495QY76_9ACTN|nr:NAD(P)-binding domain-containing protein [Actinomadura pelletieri]RKS79018.1 3-hydroxyisobutyrate dehydrogenase-like beta-hydroxyacid dehydrogenase [Actinomadura pelletieri DSM 43383]
MTKAPVTVVGLGAMGAAMAATFLENGHPTTLWNRTASRAEPLVAKGATLAATPADALAASELVILSQTDYQAMYDSLDQAADALKGRVVVNLSSGSPDELRRADEWASRHGAELLTGGIMVPPEGVGKPGSYVFYSGREETLHRHRETLGKLGETTFVGSDPGLSMLYYQAQLYLFWSTLVAYMHGVALLGTAGVAAERLRPFAATMLADLAADGTMGFLKVMTEMIDAGVVRGADHNLRMQAVGTDHIVEAAQEAGIDAAGPRALRDLLWRAVDAGHGADGLASVIEVIRRP